VGFSEKLSERGILGGGGGGGGGGEDPSCPFRLQKDEGWRDGATKGCAVWLEDDYVRAVEAEEEP